jgi:starvation-inducible DNA-binding protein
MQPNIGVSDAHRDGVCHLLNTTLADEYVLSTRTRNYHWNVIGPHFYALHLLFEKQYGELEEFIDAVAERVRSLGGQPLGTLTEFVQNTRLKDDPNERLGPREMVSSLLAEHESLIQFLRKDVTACTEKFHDVGTADFLTGMLEAHEKMAWMLRATLQTQ